MKRAPLLLALLLVPGVLVGALAVGAVSLDGATVMRGLLGQEPTAATIVRDLRLPRVLLAFLVGGSLAICGAALQALIRNPLAEPYLLGLSGGAGLGAVLAIAGQFGGAWGVPVAAFVGAMAALALVYRLSLVSGRRLDPRVLLLAGVVVGAFAGSLMSAVLVLSEARELRNAFLWLLGGFGSASWVSLSVFLAYGALPAALLFLAARRLDLLALGEETARHLGTDPERDKRVILAATGLLTAASVAVCGIIGFVGLVVPHAVRRVAGPLHRRLLPLVFLIGGSFLVVCDALARTVARPLELPVGVVTALVGVPVFAVLLRRTVA